MIITYRHVGGKDIGSVSHPSEHAEYIDIDVDQAIVPYKWEDGHSQEFDAISACQPKPLGQKPYEG